jgi:hypothetical protein
MSFFTITFKELDFTQIIISSRYSPSILKTFTHASNDNELDCHCEECSEEEIYSKIDFR